MKVSTSGMHQRSLNALLQQQSALNESQIKLSTGKKIVTPSDDPVIAARIIDLKQDMSMVSQYQDNIDTLDQRLSLEESTLRNVVNLMHRVRELTVQGLNDSNLFEDRRAIAAELDQINDTLLSLANTRNANGDYLFSGFQSNTQSFTKTTGTPNTYVYNGDANQRNIQISEIQQIADGHGGEAIFGTVGTDNIFETIETLSLALKANNPSLTSLDEIDTSLTRVLTVESEVGARLLTAGRVKEQHEDYLLNMEKTLSNAEDLDYATAISEFNRQNIALQAAQQSFARIQDLSLFNYL